MDSLILWIGIIAIGVQYVLEHFIEGKNKKRIVGIIIALIAIASIVVSKINTNKEKVESEKEKNVLSDKLTRALARGDVSDERAKEDRLEAKDERKELNNKLDSVSKKLAPFILIAQEKYPGVEMTHALNMLSKILDKQQSTIDQHDKSIDVLKNYSQWARLGMDGKTGEEITVSAQLIAMEQDNPLVTLMKDVFYPDSIWLKQRFDAPMIVACEKVIKQYPKFAFSYYALALYFAQKNKSVWKDYANKAIDILNKTILIDGHHDHHDFALKQLNELLSK